MAKDVKVLYILIGPKGAGKTYIGTLVEQNTDITLLRVEPLWLGLEEGEDGWRVEERAIHEALTRHDRVMIETLGAGDGFERLLARLQVRYAVKLIKVEADPNECLRRVQNRDNAEQMSVSDEQVTAYNAIATRVVYNWDAVIDNNGPATDEAILTVIADIG